MRSRARECAVTLNYIDLKHSFSRIPLASSIEHPNHPGASPVSSPNTLSPKRAYTRTAKLLHWAIAAVLVAQFIVGWTMPDVHRDTLPVGLVGLHLSIGAAIVALVVIRVVWRLTHPPVRADLSNSLRRISGTTHFLLYALLLAVPLAGWANASARGWDVRLLGWIHYPALVPPHSATGLALGDIHGSLAWVLLALVVLHIVAGLFHRFVLRDTILARML